MNPLLHMRGFAAQFQVVDDSAGLLGGAVEAQEPQGDVDFLVEVGLVSDVSDWLSAQRFAARAVSVEQRVLQVHEVRSVTMETAAAPLELSRLPFAEETDVLVRNLNRGRGTT